MRQLLLRHIRHYQTATDDMLKVRAQAAELLKKRLEERSREKKVPINSADFQVIGNDMFGFSPSLIVSSNGCSYMFNCHEGTQRYCFNNKIKLTNLENVFVTNCSWNKISGVFGLALTLQDSGCPELKVHSTSRLNQLFDAMRPFLIYTNTSRLPIKNFVSDDYRDKGIDVQKIALDSQIDERETGSFEKIIKRGRLERPRFLAYYCRLPDIPGALDPLKCKQFNVPVGPLLAILKSGQDITLRDGTEVKAADVCGPETKGITFLVLECPNEDFIKRLVNDSRLQRIQCIRTDADNGDRKIELVVHFSPYNVIKNPEYQKWLSKFDSDCKHLFMRHPHSKSILHETVHSFQYMLNRFDSDIFPILYLPKNLERIEQDKIEKYYEERKSTTTNLETEDEPEPTLAKVDFSDYMKEATIYPESLDRIFYRPKRLVEHVDTTVALCHDFEEAQMNLKFKEKFEEYCEFKKNQPEPREYEPEIVFLGTGSAIPSKRRNTSCILVNFHYNKFSMIMDCGEDSFGQMHRYYGPEKQKEILKQLKLIYISHQHSDHHLGLVQLIKQRKLYTDQPVILLLPPNIEQYMQFYNENIEDLSKCYEVFSTRLIKSKPFIAKTDRETESMKNVIYKKLNGFLESVDVLNVQHCVHSCAVNMKFRIGHPEMKSFSISYSGDCRPSDEFATIGLNSDLLIHEATFDHRSLEDAMLKKHSTSKEAIEVSRKMAAKYTILTHFSQRFPKIPYFMDDFDEKINFAFDNLTLRYPSQMNRLPKMKSLLSIVFEDSLQEVDMRFWKQEQRQKTINEALKAL